MDRGPLRDDLPSRFPLRRLDVADAVERATLPPQPARACRRRRLMRMSTSLALQLYSLRRETGIDPEGTLRLVPTLGFEGVELVGTYGWPAERWNQLLRETKLQVVAAHAGLESLEKDWAAQVQFKRAVRNRRLVVPS